MTKNSMDITTSLKARPKPEDLTDTQDPRWNKSMIKSKPGPKRGRRTAQIHPTVTPETAREIAEMADDAESSQGAIVERIFAEWKTLKQEKG